MTIGLAVDELRIAAGALDLVRGISLSVERGEALTILGESGSGKSLLAQAVMGTLPPELTASGTIVIDGARSALASSDRRRLWGRSLALLPQEPWLALDPTMRVLGHVAEGHVGDDRVSARAKAEAALDALGLADARRKYPFMLSGGMAQRVAFAAARAGDASLLIVDEPTKGLDAELCGQLVAMLRAALRDGRTLVTVTHDVSVARALGGAVAVMLDGQIIEQGPAEQVLASPKHAYTRRLVAAQPASWPAFPDATTTGDPLVSASGLAKSFGDKRLFADVDLAISRGSRIAICGPSGSGKTTLGNMLLGLIPPDRGRIARAPGLAALRLQKLYQEPPAAFVPGLAIRHALNDLVARHNLNQGAVAPLMHELGLGDHLLDRRPDQISGGELQRFALLRVLLLDPYLIFADEPTSRLDPIIQQDTMNLLVTRAGERRCALLLVTHDADIARKVAGNAVIHVSQYAC